MVASLHSSAKAVVVDSRESSNALPAVQMNLFETFLMVEKI
jgi:hypothetical protein